MRKESLDMVTPETHYMLCPELASMKNVKLQIGHMSMAVFVKKYQLAMREGEMVQFSRKDIAWARELGAKIFIQPNMTNNITQSVKSVAISVDIATIGKQSKYSVALVMAYTMDDLRIPIWMERGQWTWPKFKQMIIDLWWQFKADYVIVESNAMQVHLISDLKVETQLFTKYGAGKNTMKIVSSFTGNNKHDPDTGVPSLSGVLDSKLIAIPSGNDFARNMFKPLITELKKYPGMTTDTVMAWWMNELFMRKKLGLSCWIQKGDTIRDVRKEVRPKVDNEPTRTDSIVSKLIRTMNYATAIQNRYETARKRFSSTNFRSVRLPIG